MFIDSQKMNFHPTLLGFFFNPYFLLRYNLYNNIENIAKDIKGNLLDFGCGSKPYQNLFFVDEYVGVDIEVSGHKHNDSKVDFYYNGKVLPFKSETFDNVFSSEVFEHLFNIDEILCEINRVLKNDGYLLFTTPFVWEEHEVPYDFGRYAIFGMEHILKKNGFSIVKQKKSTDYISTIIQLFISYLYQVIPLPSKIKRLLNPFIIMPFTLIGIVLSYLLPNNHRLFINHVILAQKNK